VRLRLVVIAALAALGASAGPAAAAPKLAPADRAAIRDVLTRYIPAVLERRDPRLGYELSGPQVRGSTTLKEWLRGDLPVYPFPARGDRVEGWQLTYAEPGDVGLDLLIQPRKGAKVPAIAFKIQMTKIRGAWKVNAFYPEATFDTAKAKVFSPQDATANGVAAQVPQPKISGDWLALPAVLIAAVLVLGPLTWFVVARRRERSAYRAYLERTGAS
jgi:hypothetical protein